MASNVKVGITATDEGFSQTLKQMEQNAQAFGNSMQASGGKAKTLNGQLREARKAAQELTLQWRSLDDAAKASDFGKSLQSQLQDVLNTAGQLQDIKGDVANEIKNIASDTMIWDGAKQGIGVLSSSMQGLAGVVGLCGGNVESFTKALNVMKTVEAAANSVIAIGNALQKNSALMVAFRAVKEALFGKAKLASTAATVANTAATGAETVATEGATTAQLALNAAILANPYVAAAAALVALVGAIVYFTSSSDEATAATEGLHEATEAATEANIEGYKAYMKMEIELTNVKTKVDNFNGSKEEEKQLVQELNDKYGDALGYYQDLAHWKAALTEVSYYYCKVLEKEAILSAISTQAAEAYAKAMAGEDYDKNWAKYEKLRAMIEGAADDLQAYQFMLKVQIDAAGGTSRPKPRSSGGGHHSTRKSSGSSTPKKQGQTADDKKRQTALEALNKQLEETKKKYDAIKDKEGKGAKKAQEYTQKMISLEKEKLQYLVHGTDEYTNQLKKIQSYYSESSQEYKDYAELIRQEGIKALELQFEGYDLEIQEEYEGALSTLREIISKLKEGTDEYNKWEKTFEEMFPMEYWQDKKSALERKRQQPGLTSDQINDINDEIYKAEQKINDLNINLGIEDAPQTDYERYIGAYNKYLADVRNSARQAENARVELDKDLAEADAKLAQELRDGLITQAEYNERSEKLYAEYIDKMGNLPGVLVYDDKITQNLQNIARYWQDVISDLEKQLNENDLDVEARLQILDDKRAAQEKLDAITKGELTIKATVEPEYIVKGSVWDKRQSYDNQAQKIQQIADDYAKGIIKTAAEAKAQIAQLNAELVKLGMNPVEIEIKTEAQKTLEDVQDYMGNFNDVVVSTTDSFKTLIDSIEEGANGWEIFKNSLSAAESVLTAISTIMNLVNTFQEASNVATAAGNVLSDESAISKTEEAVAQTVIASTSPAVVAAMEAQATAAGTALAPVKQLGAAMLELAAANMFAAHSEIPFVGAALGAASVGIMMGVMAGLKTLDKFAQGGIVRGSTTMGDNVLVRASAGEMILNKTQQGHLFKMLNEGIMPNDNTQTVTSVRVKGSDLYLALKNYSKIKGKSGITTGIQ